MILIVVLMLSADILFLCTIVAKIVYFELPETKITALTWQIFYITTGRKHGSVNLCPTDSKKKLEYFGLSASHL